MVLAGMFVLFLIVMRVELTFPYLAWPLPCFVCCFGRYSFTKWESFLLSRIMKNLFWLVNEVKVYQMMCMHLLRSVLIFLFSSSCKLLILYWGIANSQCCDSFRWTAIHHIYTYIHSPQAPLPSRKPHSMKQLGPQ